MSNIIEVTNIGNIVQVMDDGKTIEVLAGGVITVNGGGGGGGATNLAYTASPTNGIVTSDTGTDATIPAGNTTNASLMLPADKTKLDGVQAGATANATDAQLRDRATHTGTQAISTVSGLQTALDGKQPTGDYATNTALTNGLATKANISHTHVIADVTNLQTTLDGKAPLVHTHVIADVTGLQTALNGKEPTITAGTSAQYYRGDKTFQTLDKTAVGLSNVDNTSDLNKPISTATQTALNAKQETLVSGTNIKTINSQSLLGSGNITISGGGGSATDLAYVASSTNGVVTSSTGTSATIPAGSTTNASLMLPADKTKLDGIASGATANSTDAQLRDRTTHTGAQAISTITGLQTALDGKASTVHTHIIGDVTGLQTALDAKQATLVSGTNIKTINNQPITGSGDLTVNGTTNLSTTASATNVIVNSSTGTGATIALADATNAGLFSPSEKTKLSGIATGATANSTDAQLRDRSTHTGTQLASTISDFASTVLATLLTGLSTATNTAVLATDSILIALGKLQAQITSLGASKENTITAGTTSQYFRGDKTFQTLDKTAVGLSNVDNTSDLNKPISTATQTALNAKENTLNADQKRKVTISTASPTGGVDGDVWLQYTP